MNVNVGADDYATHGTALNKLPRAIRKQYQLPVYECGFPISHPAYVCRDIEYEKYEQYMLGSGMLLVKLGRKAESLWLALINGDFKRIAGKIYILIYKRKEK